MDIKEELIENLYEAIYFIEVEEDNYYGQSDYRENIASLYSEKHTVQHYLKKYFSEVNTKEIEDKAKNQFKLDLEEGTVRER